MDREPSAALSPAEAKARLRIAASRLSMSAWVRHHPYETLGIAAAGGLLLGSVPGLGRLLGRGTGATVRRLFSRGAP